MIALLVPVYFFVWFLLLLLAAKASEPSGVLGPVVMLLGLVTVGAHFVAGYWWARWLIGLLTLIFAGFQWPVFMRGAAEVQFWMPVPILVLLGVSTVVAANAVWLLAAKPAAAFLDARRASLSAVNVRLLRNLRWVLAGAVFAAVMMDVRRMMM